MNKILSMVTFFILMVVSGFSTTINIPENYPTIQEGIDASIDGDTVLIAQGLYYENLSINKEITLASHFILDGDISHRDATIIDGSNYDEDSGPFGSCVLFRPSDNGEAISAELTGFTIRNGKGTRVNETIILPDWTEHILVYYMGGGFMIDHCLPVIQYNLITNNGVESTGNRGGGSQRGGGGAFNNSDGVEFDEDRSEPHPRTTLTRDDHIIISNNIFEDNVAETGHTFESIEFSGNLDFSGSHFDVAYTDEDNPGNNGVSEYWIADDGESSYSYTNINGNIIAITYDVWVSPDGVDEVSTPGTEEHSFKTINYALNRIYPTEENPITINLSDGTYSPTTTGENFPILMISNVNLLGQGEDVTILDAEQTNRVITMESCENNTISDLIITGGLADGDWPNFNGGGIYCNYSSPTITEVIIEGNNSYHGGGINCEFSSPILTNVTIYNNSALDGGGILCSYGSNLSLNNVTITSNSATHYDGGGLWFNASSPVITNVTITDNFAGMGGGGMYCSYGNPILSNVTCTGNTAVFGGGMYWVTGSAGTLTNVTISDNTAGALGGGFAFWGSSNPILENVMITGNSAGEWGGGGVACWFSSNPSFVNVTITGNMSDVNGGGIRCNNSSPIFVNSILWNDSPEEIFLEGSAINIFYSDIQSGWTGEGNINADPLFVDLENGDFSLQEGSPGIDAGTAFFEIEAEEFFDYGQDGIPGTYDYGEGNGYYNGEEEFTDINGNGIWDPGLLLDMSEDQYYGNAPDMGAFEYGMSGGTDITVFYNTDWNIVGLPLEVANGNYQNLFLNVYSGTLYSHDINYQPEQTLETGGGYLLRFIDDESVTFSGIPLNEITISLSAGWNLFSGLSTALMPEYLYSFSIIQDGTLNGLDGDYFSPESIEPGIGYWVRAIEDGEITLTSDGSARQVPFVNRMNDANSISFSNESYSTNLYFGVDVPENEKLSYSLPPTFPQMAFDVRFSGDMKYVVDSGEIGVLNHSETLNIGFDIKVEAGENLNWVLTTESGKKYILEGTGELTVPSAERFVLYRGSVIPITFVLHQNFPNPFNPITTLRYDLPSDALVTLSIYDMLGREITQLVNTTQKAGFKSIQWGATDSMGKPVSAGVYLYQIQAGEIIQTRKMVLLK